MHIIHLLPVKNEIEIYKPIIIIYFHFTLLRSFKYITGKTFY